MIQPFRLKPHYAPRIWGGRNLEKVYGKAIPQGNIGESWEISSHPDGLSRVAQGPLAGKTLAELADRWGYPALVGREAAQFPLLIKILDARDILSVQVHPDDAYAQKAEGELGKAEAWVILAAQPGARIVYGVKPGTQPQAFRRAMETGATETLLNWVEVKPGDVFNIPAGMVHALGAGILVYEVQQNSNSVYRVFDWNRLEEGKPRQLHVEKAMDVIDWQNGGQIEGAPGLAYRLGEERGVLTVVSPYFTLERLSVEGNLPLAPRRFHALTVVEGEGTLEWAGGRLDLGAGDSACVPAALEASALRGDMTVMDAGLPDRKRLRAQLAGRKAKPAAVPGLAEYLEREEEA